MLELNLHKARSVKTWFGMARVEELEGPKQNPDP